MLPPVTVTKGKNANWLTFNTDDEISMAIRRNGEWARLEVDIALAALMGREDATVLDIGANLGGFTVPVAKNIGVTRGKIIAFEPQRVIFQQLCANSIINRLDNVFAYQFAVGSSQSFIEAPTVDYSHSKNIGSFSLLKEIQSFEKKYATRISYFEEKQEIPVISLDEFLTDCLANFIKIDVEGYESEVLLGATKFLKKSNFPPILYEEWPAGKFHDDREQASKKNAELCRELLQDLRYQCFSVAGSVLAIHPEGPVKLATISQPSGMQIRFEKNP